MAGSSPAATRDDDRPAIRGLHAGFRVSGRPQSVSAWHGQSLGVFESTVWETAHAEHDAPASVRDEARWAAVVARDPRCDGSFVYSVVTTGVYCQPSCPGRPKRENVRFHATWADAEAEGFRPCKRCKLRDEPRPIRKA